MIDPAVPLPPLRQVIAAHGLSARKALGQNFLLDPQLLGRIASLAGELSDTEVLEIGPGPGGLTRALLERGAKVIAIERDARCVTALEELAAAYPTRLKVVAGDALKIDIPSLFEGPPAIVSNLPYNIGTALLVDWLSATWPPWWRDLTLMFQREVAERIVAAAATPAYGRLSVLTQCRSSARIVLPVHRSAFTPAPKVMSAVVRIEPRSEPSIGSIGTIERVTAAAFGQRRKMLRQSLRAVPGALAALDRLGIDPTRRAETVSVAEFVAIAAALSPTP